MTDAEYARLQEFGQGNASAGVRYLLYFGIPTPVFESETDGADTRRGE